ncbi:hypothetical protein GPA10_35125 [Streptomyces sp. p1417]|uniref:Uncharacterized protein n=1 Tax=Streptomyces typhae TaxID=2681492 RepID=A0A6L6X7Q9_9ACTN|nr:hypothetical protein [Streptomyces typhae]MVO89848.1 hypothetical protein [Streptomyces typhae]
MVTVVHEPGGTLRRHRLNHRPQKDVATGCRAITRMAREVLETTEQAVGQMLVADVDLG